MCTIYILECNNNKFYVGKTSRPIHDRIVEHFNKYGSEWTKKYKPLGIKEIIENADNSDEDKYVKIYMNLYGISNVRGGSYSQIILPDYKLQALTDELNTLNNNCFKCGKHGHYANNCTYNITCYKCGNFGHYTNTCTYDTICYKCGDSGHYSNKCTYTKSSISDNDDNKLKHDVETCYCCGRIGHNYKNCNYDKTIYGNKIDKINECIIL